MTINPKFKRVAAIASGIAVATASASVEARQTTGFAAFRVFNPAPGTNPYSCLVEQSGAVLNECPYDITLVFGLMIDNAGTHSMTVQSYWGSNASFPLHALRIRGHGPGNAGEQRHLLSNQL